MADVYKKKSRNECFKNVENESTIKATGDYDEKLQHKSVFENILKIDHLYSKKISIYNGKFSRENFQKSRIILKSFEWTGHGVPWLILAPILAYTSTEEKREFFINLTIALLYDLIVISILKLSFRRSRPQYNEEGDMPLSASKIDGFSFPSGHATRGFMVLILFMFYDISLLQKQMLFIWAILLGFSRIALGRHHISDVIAGAVVGLIEAATVINYLWYKGLNSHQS